MALQEPWSHEPSCILGQISNSLQSLEDYIYRLGGRNFIFRSDLLLSTPEPLEFPKTRRICYCWLPCAKVWKKKWVKCKLHIHRRNDGFLPLGQHRCSVHSNSVVEATLHQNFTNNLSWQILSSRVEDEKLRIREPEKFPKSFTAIK